MADETATRVGMLSKPVLLRGIALYLASLAALTLAVELVYRGQIADSVNQIRQTASEMVALEEEAALGALRSVASDVLFLAEQNELREYLETGEAEWLDAVAEEYLAFTTEKRIYDQVRFLDERGFEIVRANYDAGDPSIVPPNLLQAKGRRYYFIRSFVRDAGEVYVSPFDLNVDGGRVEVPWKPTIRFGTPVFDASGRRRGIVVLNYLGDNMLDTLRKAGGGTIFKIFLTNSEGYWLLGPDPHDEWGFMFYGEGVRTVDSSFPGLWTLMRTGASGQFRTEAGLFAFTTIDPSQAVPSESRTSPPSDPETEPYRWKLMVHVPAAVLSSVAGPIRRTWGFIYGTLTILAAVVSWLFARLQVARNRSRRRVEFLAKYDALTGACNRHFFEQTISDEVARAKRYRHPISFLMVDITWFKQINDTHGHKVGDEVLKEVAARLRESVRDADIVVRYGGDEFLIMFPETSGEADAARNRILKTVEALNAGSTFGFRIVLALGSAHWDPDSGESVEDVLTLADERMYEHKQSQHAAMNEGG